MSHTPGLVMRKACEALRNPLTPPTFGRAFFHFVINLGVSWPIKEERFLLFLRGVKWKTRVVDFAFNRGKMSPIKYLWKKYFFFS